MSKRPSVTKLADRTVGSPQLEEGAVTPEILDQNIVDDITDASADAATALSTANGKNKVYRQSAQPTGGTYADGDLWFDTDDDNKIYRYASSSSTWVGFTLGDNALASLSATKITAGTIDASVITVSNLDAGNITVGTLNGIEVITDTGSIGGWDIRNDGIESPNGNIYLFSDAGGGASSIVVGSGPTSQIVLVDNGEIATFFGDIQTGINFQTDTSYVFRIEDASNNRARISPTIFTADSPSSFSYLASNEIVTTGEVSMDVGYVTGPGIRYPGCTTGPGTANYMGLVWDNPDIRGTVDNVVSAVLGTVSDIRSKANVVDAPNDWALKTLNNLRVVEYNPINILSSDDTTEKPKRLGLIAQELVNVFPELVTSASPDNPDAILSVNYSGLVPHLIQVVKLLSDRIESLEQRTEE